MLATHETLILKQSIRAALPRVWNAFADVDQRAAWGVPAGEAQIYDVADFRVGGREQYKCGPPGNLEFYGFVDYAHIIPQSIIVHSDTVTAGGKTLATALLTWEFESDGEYTKIQLTDQVTSLVGIGMINGHRNGHTKALDQLRELLEKPA